MTRLGSALLISVSLVAAAPSWGCGAGTVAAGESDGAGDEPGGEDPAPADLPPPPTFDGIDASCPGGTNSGDCVVSGSGGCAVGCDLPEPCDDVRCSFQSSIDPVIGCVDLPDVDALSCVFDTFAEGAPFQFSLQLADSESADGSSIIEHYWVLPGERVLVTRDESDGADAGGFTGVHTLRWSSYAPNQVALCGDLSPSRAYQCLQEALRGGCAAPASLECPAG